MATKRHIRASTCWNPGLARRRACGYAEGMTHMPQILRHVLQLAAAGFMACALCGCAVVSVASATVSVASTAVSVGAGAVGLAADAAIGTAKIAGKAVGATADAVLPGDGGH